jgi:hypothetical protein
VVEAALGVDYDEHVTEYPCLRGKGALEHTRKSALNKNGSSVSFACEDCAKAFFVSLHLSGSYDLRRATAFRLSDRDAQLAAASDARRAWDAHSRAIETKAQPRSKLDALPTMTAKWRWLTERNFYRLGLREFRREWCADPDAVVSNVVFAMRRYIPWLREASEAFDQFPVPEVPQYTLDLNGEGG